MRSMGTRRAALFAGVATVTAAALTGCSAGQVAQTANKQPSVYGVNAANADQSVLVRNLSVGYGAVQGYPAGGAAPLEFGLYNQTRQPVTVRIESAPPATMTAGVVSARAVQLTGGTAPGATSSASAQNAPSGTASASPNAPASPNASASPGVSASPTGTGQAKPGSQAGQGSADPSPSARTERPAEPPQRPAELTIAPLSSVTFLPGDAEGVQLVGLVQALKPGNSVNLVLSFSNGAAPLTLLAPVAIPNSPAPRGSAEVDEAHEAG